MASVRKRTWTHKGASKEAWVVSYTDQGGKRRIKTFDKKKDADRERQRIEADVLSGTHTPDANTLKVAEAVQRFLDDCDLRHRLGTMAGNTVLNYRFALRHFVKRFGGQLLNEIASDPVQSWLNDMLIERYAPNSVRTCYVAAHTFLMFCVRKRWLKRNILIDEPCRQVPTQQRRTAIPSKDDIRAMLKDADTWQRAESLRAHVTRGAYLALGLFAGMRPGEIFGLQWEDIDRAAGLIHIRHSHSRIDKLKAPKTKAGIRSVPLSPPIIYALDQVERFLAVREKAYGPGHRSYSTAMKASRLRRAWLNPKSPSRVENLRGYVLLGKGEQPFRADAYSWIWRAMMTRLGLVDPETKRPLFSMHALRHAAASLMIEAGMPPLHLKTFIGHSSVSTTFDVYGHLLSEDGTTPRVVSAVAADFARLPSPARQESDMDQLSA